MSTIVYKAITIGHTKRDGTMPRGNQALGQMDVSKAIKVLSSDPRFKSVIPILHQLCGEDEEPPPRKILKTSPKVVITVYTDGACSGNPGPGGWGVYFESSGETHSGGEDSTTNNRMELTAAIVALEKTAPHVDLTVFTDSQYVKKGITEWSPKWKANGWKTASGGVVKNQDLWKQLSDACESHTGTLSWEWVKGHSGDAGNARADELAVSAMKSKT